MVKWRQVLFPFLAGTPIGTGISLGLTVVGIPGSLLGLALWNIAVGGFMVGVLVVSEE
jgi:hypothetical protein